MEKIGSMIQTMIVPSFLLGISTNTVFSKFPGFGELIGLIGLALFVAVFLFWLFFRFTMKIIPRRFANLIYLLDDDNKLAVIKHPHYKRIQPPGTRLGYHEKPHSAIERAIREELGLEPSSYSIWPDMEYPKFSNTEIVPGPYQVQVERNKHRLGVKEHYDYVYVCKTRGKIPELNKKYDARFLSLDELEHIRDSDAESAPWSDIIPTYKKILADMKIDSAQS